MKYLKKIGIFLVIFAFVFQSVSVPISAMSNEEQLEIDEFQLATILLDEDEEFVPLFEENSKDSKILNLLQSDDEVVILERLDEFSFVEFIQEDDKKKVLQGFILNDSLSFNENEILDNVFQTATILAGKNEIEIPLYEEGSEDSDILTFLQSDDEVVILESSGDFSFVEYTENDEKIWQGFILSDFLHFKEDYISKEENFDQDENTENEKPDKPVDESESEDNSITIDTEENPEEPEDVSKGESVNELEEDQSSDFKEKTDKEITSEDELDETDKDAVKEKQKSFSIQGSSLPAQEQTYFGIALQDNTHVYASQSTSSTKLRTYKQGSILKYRSLNADWYVATVRYNGKWAIGYIHKNHVENITDSQSVLHGIALQNPTKIYSKASTGASTLRSYAQGSILKYKTLTSDWYEATVMYNGKWTSGYIHKNDVENVINNQETINGIGLKDPTKVYSRASTNGPVLKSYSEGSTLKYKTFSDNWYQATVYINGKPKIGYIHKSHVENTVNKQESLRGIGLRNPTTVYGSASTNSKKLKSYAEGTVLKYKTFSSSWYEATVYIKGKAHTGYIHTDHVEGLDKTNKSLDGIGLKNPTNIYSKASKNSDVLKSYGKGSYLIFKTFSLNWYEATVYIKGKRITGYIHLNDVSTERILTTTTNYTTNFNKVVDIQMSKKPKADGAGKIDATRSQVEYYVNSSNFGKNSTDYFQFLVLSKPAGLNITEVNQKILSNHGSLTGQAKSFIEAGKKFNINEAYLISHALLETGNGSSRLAQGVPVDNKGNVVEENKKVHTVYNMYGIGAVDSDALKGGAKRAFDERWFTPEEAIIGGAEFINTYITRGQDTLYKMRWNPISPGYPQYATDVGWAVKQTANISRIYSLLDNYILIYDIPKYSGQPSSSGNPEYVPDLKGTHLEVTEPNGVRIRDGAGTSNNIVGTAPKGTKLILLLDKTNKIISKATGGHIWYQIEFEGSIAWISGGKNGTEYVKVLK